MLIYLNWFLLLTSKDYKLYILLLPCGMASISISQEDKNHIPIATQCRSRFCTQASRTIASPPCNTHPYTSSGLSTGRTASWHGPRALSKTMASSMGQERDIQPEPSHQLCLDFGVKPHRRTAGGAGSFWWTDPQKTAPGFLLPDPWAVPFVPPKALCSTVLQCPSSSV